MLDVALVGLGSWGRTLVDAVQADGRPTQDELRVTTVVPRAASDAVRDYAARQRLRVATLDEALADGSIGGVLLATPH
ncbi:MAG: gfo/Idh/MocA family oxidoreductase, partial [Alphaproteobacteria bacterium]